jgi:hypothetical protein
MLTRNAVAGVVRHSSDASTADKEFHQKMAPPHPRSGSGLTTPQLHGGSTVGDGTTCGSTAEEETVWRSVAR